MLLLLCWAWANICLIRHFCINNFLIGALLLVYLFLLLIYLFLLLVYLFLLLVYPFLFLVLESICLTRIFLLIITTFCANLFTVGIFIIVEIFIESYDETHSCFLQKRKR